MESNLILNVPGLKKILRVFLFLVILCSVDFMDARITGQAEQPATSVPTQTTARVPQIIIQNPFIPASAPSTPAATNPFLTPQPSAPANITDQYNWFLGLQYWTLEAERHLIRDVLGAG